LLFFIVNLGGLLFLEILIEVLLDRGIIIYQLAVRKATQDLKGSHRWIFNNINNITNTNKQNVAKKKVVRLGEIFQVVNKWCFFVEVSPKKDEEILIENTTSFLHNLLIRSLPFF
jgi:hypothetical protein